ncbi:hypothetical protein OHB35_53045 [Streptomyces phaeochromogenes]|uniref:DUF6895 domain-containing protein n=1 Tax=Streptomyces phaeochromogenes TaxID=1923 RepID=A0ABZ1HRQ8_STRPH|nr:hypothetical protein [Streptomyces phaeochromogenes]WSD21270.1 hypothetical protein OHB35_53045 [Streptomyces phaeochromogenes]
MGCKSVIEDDRLRKRVRVILNWAAEVVAESLATSEIWAPKSPDPELDGGDSVRPLEKMLSEAALLALLGHRALGYDPSVERLLDSIEGHHESLDWIYERIREDPHLWASGGLVWVVLDSFSRADYVKRTRLRALWNKGIAQPAERLPFRVLDQAWVEGLALNRSNAILGSDIYLSTTSLGNLEAGLSMAPRDLYAVTHCAMYITDFGRHTGPPVAPGWIGPLALARLLAVDLDLVGELTLAEVLLSPASPHIGALISARNLGVTFDALGYIPGPPASSDSLQKTKYKNDILRYRNYHPTFVYGVLCCVVAGRQSKMTIVGDLLTHKNPNTTFELPLSEDAGSLADRIAHHFQAWLPILDMTNEAYAKQELLRAIIDAYIIEAVNQNRTKDLLALLGMSSVAGPSSVDLAARQLLMTRASLAGADDVYVALRQTGIGDGHSKSS